MTNLGPYHGWIFQHLVPYEFALPELVSLFLAPYQRLLHLRQQSGDIAARFDSLAVNLDRSSFSDRMQTRG